MIEGWSSYQEYKDHCNMIASSVGGTVDYVEATPDQIIEMLQDYGLPNDPTDRSTLYGLVIGNEYRYTNTEEV